MKKDSKRVNLMLHATAYFFLKTEKTKCLSMRNLYQPYLKKMVAASTLFFLLLSTPVAAQQVVEVVVRIKVTEELASQLETRPISRDASGRLTTGVESVDQIHRQFNVKSISRIFPHAGKFEARHRRHGLHLWYEIKMGEGISVSSVLQSYKSDKHILRAEAVLQKAIIGSSSRKFASRIIRSPELTPAALPDASNDPLLASQWHYNNTGQSGGTQGSDINLFDAWKVETGKPQVIVAVTDGGIQTDHPDLAPNMWLNTNEVADNNIDDDNNGYVDDIHGYSFVTERGKIDPHEHGTHVAGTVAAVSNNGLGVAGIAGGSGSGDGARLMSCAVFHTDSTADGFAQAYVYSADNGAVISQNSWGYTMPGLFEQVVIDAIDYFINEAGKNELGQQVGPMNGGLVIFSTGNFNDEANYYPAFYERVLAVTATDHADVRADYANYGTWVDIAAPGGETYENEAEGVVSTLPNDQYGTMMGTSMACPHVSGVAALVVSKFGKQGFQPDAARARLLLSVDDISKLNGQFTGKLGTGRLNAGLALRESDGVAPERINDLAVEKVDVGSITLTWTSPGDDGDFVAAYDLRYSTSPITETNFMDATQVKNTPTPSAPGTKETFTVDHLQGGIRFYFAIRSRDFDGNFSKFSNVISRTSAFTPVLVVTPLSISQNLKTAEIATRILTIKNHGKGVLKYSISVGEEDAFVSVTPAKGELSPGTQQAIKVKLDASRKLTGTYRQEITIVSNDPDHRSLAVPITLNVTNNGAPIAYVEPKTIDFNAVQRGTELHRIVKIYNEGSDPLIIKEISSDNSSFKSDFHTPFTLTSFKSADIRVTFSPMTTGIINGRIRILTDDPDHQHLSVQVTGEGMQKAPIAVVPQSFDETLERGSSVTRSMTLTNNASQERTFRLEVRNSRLAHEDVMNVKTYSESGRQKSVMDDTTRKANAERLRALQEKFAAQGIRSSKLVRPFPGRQRAIKNNNSSARSTDDKATAYKRDVRKYLTGFENFRKGPLGESEGWFATQGWSIAEENADHGVKHFRGTSRITGAGESYAISPYLFEYEEFYYPQYSYANMRINLDKAQGVTWEVVPQDPWSYVATRIRFNPDGTIDALVVDNDYESHWRKVPASIPSGYFDLAVEYNNAGSDTSGFPTYYLFINNKHVFSGTGLGSGIGQVAFVSPMESEGAIFDMDEFELIGGEYIPPFVRPGTTTGVIRGGQSVNIPITFDASLLKPGTFKSDLVIFLDEIDSLVVPATVTVPGEPSLFRDLNSLYLVLEKNEPGRQAMNLRNTGGTPVNFNFEYDLPGLQLTPQSGSLQVRQEEVVDIKFDGAPGIYESEILIHTDISPEPDIMEVFILKMDSGAIFHAPAQLTLDARAGAITTHTFQVRNDGINTVSFVTQSSLDSIVSIDPPTATIADEPLELTLTVDARHLSPGSFTAYVRFNTNDPEQRSFYTNVKLNVLHGSETAGKIMREIWTGISGKEITSIPVSEPPTATESLTAFEAPSNAGDNYGARIRGWIVAPTTGSYKFWIASNDNSELWLSTDETQSKKRKIASVTGYTNARQWNKFPSQVSASISLVANKKYYIEALHKEGTGSDHIAVGWQLPGGALEQPIPGIRLIPFGEDISNSIPVVTILSPEEGNLFSSPATIDITADASDEDGTIVKVEFFNGNSRLFTDATAPYAYRWKNVAAGNYHVKVRATDNSGAVDSAFVSVTVSEGQSCTNAGRIIREQWNGISGTLISSIPVDSEPSSKGVLTLFESASNIGDNYGSRIRGFLCVPETGNYTFWIASNDKSELWLSTDANPLNKVRIAYVSGYTNERQWRKFATQQSQQIFLRAGTQYYIEALHKEGVGTDHLSVGWQLPDGTLERPISGARLLPFSDIGEIPAVSITKPRASDTFVAPAEIEISANATDDGTVRKVAFYNGSQKIGEDISAPYLITWTNVPAGIYSLTAVATDNDGHSVTSQPVSVQVQATCSASGSITREFWNNVTGNFVSSIPLNTAPTGRHELTRFEGPSNAGSNYGARISGYICPPATGDYYFWIASNDHSELWLSSNADPGNRQLIASVTGATNAHQWDKFASQKSIAIKLTQGHTYYIEALHKQGVGIDHIAVGWQLPDGTLERPIQGSRLSPVRATAAAASPSALMNTFVEDTSAAISVDVYPNPVKGEKLNIVIDRPYTAEDGETEIVIRQMTGLSVYRETIDCAEGCSTEIDVLSKFTPGVYILQIRNGGGRYAEKIVVPGF